MSSSSYDPRRSRPRPATAGPGESAPVEALLGAEPTNGSHPPKANGSTPGPVPSPATRVGAPSRLVQLTPALVVGSLLAVVIWWLTRRRS